jgi:ornithine cyclodeaminase/alanine dehydrogenase-like protein (mu-crystallin family)
MSTARNSGSFLWIAEADVAQLLSIVAAIDAVERALFLEAHGDARNMLKTHVGWGDGNGLHAIGAAVPASGFVGTKTWAHTEGGATPLLILFDVATGALRAVIEAFVLGQLRTGAVSGVATRALAAKDAAELAIIGTGKQMLAQVAAVAAVRPLRRVRVFSPNAAHRARAVQCLQESLDVDAMEVSSVRAAVEGAPIITLATRARQPFLTADMLARGVHINAIGAITPERAEFAEDLFVRCDRVVADSVAAARKLSREFIDHYDDDEAAWQRVTPLSTIVAQRARRPAGADVTLFKAMGMGIADLALGIEVYERAGRHGVGMPLPAPERVGAELGRR